MTATRRVPTITFSSAVFLVISATTAVTIAGEDTLSAGNADWHHLPYDDAIATLFLRGPWHRASRRGRPRSILANQEQLPQQLHSGQLFAAAHNRVSLPLPPPPSIHQRCFGLWCEEKHPGNGETRTSWENGYPHTTAGEPPSVMRHKLSQKEDGSDNDEDERDRFERARTLMRIEYERISALEAIDATLALAAATATTAHQQPPPRISSQLEPVVDKTPPLYSHSNVSAVGATNVSTMTSTSSSGDGAHIHSSLAGKTLFVCGAVVFLLAMTGAAIGLANRRRSRRQSYPCWERQLQNGLASPCDAL